VEDDDLIGAYGHHFISASTPVLAPPPGVRGDLEIVQALAEVLDAHGGEQPIAPRIAGSARDWKRRMLKAVAPHGIDLEALEKRAVRSPVAPKVLFEGRRFATPSGRVNLVHEAPPDATPERRAFPLWLFSNATEKSQSSQWADGKEPEEITATCHPDAAPGLAENELVLLESPLGALEARLRLDPLQRRDVVLVPKGGSFDRGTCANALIAARATDEGDGAAYLDCRVRLVARPVA
jgi:anaerobic selenocysteine-containing dehydrogenase